MNFIWFDYHKECKGMKMENLKKLLNNIQPELNKYGIFECKFELTSDGTVD